MFERFTAEARQVVVGAQHEARRLHHGPIGTEHLLLGLLAQRTPSVGRARPARADAGRRSPRRSAAYVGNGDLDAEALTALGIDLDAVRDHGGGDLRARRPGPAAVRRARRLGGPHPVHARGRRRSWSCRCGRRSR